MSILRDITIYLILRSYAEQNDFSQNRHNLKTLRLV